MARRGWQGKCTSRNASCENREAMDEKILIVDDEPNVLEGLQRVLRKEFSVVAAIGGEAGLKAVAE